MADVHVQLSKKEAESLTMSMGDLKLDVTSHGMVGLEAMN